MSSANSIPTSFNTRIGTISGTPFNETSVGGSIISSRPERWQTVVVLLQLTWPRVRSRQHRTIRSYGRNLTERRRLTLLSGVFVLHPETQRSPRVHSVGCGPTRCICQRCFQVLNRIGITIVHGDAEAPQSAPATSARLSRSV